MIQKIKKCFILSTDNTTYVFNVMESGHLEHLYYGKKIKIRDESDIEALVEKHEFVPGNVNVYDDRHTNFSLEDMRLEMSSYGKGDIREPFVEITHSDGSKTSDFLFKDSTINLIKEEFDTLPGSYSEGEETEHLCVRLKDFEYNILLELHYYVYSECDVITRSARIINTSDEDISIDRLMSLQIDFDDRDYVFSTFNGAWAREMRRNDTKITKGRLINSSFTGSSSNRANPFVMLSKENTDEDNGICYGFNLIYSGNHYEAVEVSSFNKTRFVTGINPTGFSFNLSLMEKFEAPEAVMTFSDKGFNGMSRNMHRFIREHIVRGKWKNTLRPILLNSWEACYFDINESKILNLAKEASELGIELFVMDDGWFGERNDDSSSLGDWDVNLNKLPGGLKGISESIKKLGMQFGIWVEPEMVNVNSNLYKKHPDWVLEIPGHKHSEGRNQRILDLTNDDVVNFIVDKMTEIFSSADISYVKWDMNRTFTDFYSKNLPPEKQGEVFHRYIIGLYKCLKKLTTRFPDILFEGCAAGGNRFDLGILSYFPQIWASDNTDALCRVEIQNGYSYGYPQSVYSAHVSGCPNHQTLRTTPLDTRFNVAAFGILGYEVNVCDLKKADKDAIKEQINVYKKFRRTLQYGQFYRGRYGNITEWNCVSESKKRAVGMIFQRLVEPNTQSEVFISKGLNEDYRYHFFNRKLKYSVKNFGDLVNTVAPIHVKQDSLVHNVIDKFVKMDGEVEDYRIYGDVLMNSGVRLKQGFSATGYNENIRYFQDFSSRMYFIIAEE